MDGGTRGFSSVCGGLDGCTCLIGDGDVGSIERMNPLAVALDWEEVLWISDIPLQQSNKNGMH